MSEKINFLYFKVLTLLCVFSIMMALPMASSAATSTNQKFAISNLNATKITGDSAVISWNLTDKGMGYVEFGTSKYFGQKSKQESSFRFDKHVQTITGLRKNTTYYYRARSAGRDNRWVTSDTKTFSTTPPTAEVLIIDKLPLTISGLEATSIKDDSAVIKWKLNQKGTGYVEFGTSHNLGEESKKETSFNWDAHTQTISGLKPDTRYYYRVRSSDIDKNEKLSSIVSFKTAALAMKISNVSAKADTNNVVFTWDLNQHGTGVVEYGVTKDFGQSSKLETSLKWDSHRQEVNGLKPNTTYYYRVKSKAKDGEEVASGTYSFRSGSAPVAVTTAPTASPVPAPTNTGGSSTGTVGWPKNANGNLPLAGIFYGNHQTGVGVQNSAIAIESSRRFRAERSGTLTYVKYQNRTLNMANITDRCKSLGPDSMWCDCVNAGLDEYTCGYSTGSNYTVGNGGKIVVELRTNASNGMPSNQVLAKTNSFVPLDNRKIAFPELRFTSPARVQAGQIYHLVFTNLNPPTRCTALSNIKPSEAKNCPRDQGAQGMDGPRLLSKFSTTGIRGPFLGDTAAASLFRRTKNSGWSTYHNMLAYFEVGYSDGVSVGDSYTPYNAMSQARHTITGNTKARQKFVVRDASRNVNGMWLNFGHTKTSDGSPLKVVLKDKGGKTLATGSIKASSSCIKTVKAGTAVMAHWCQDWGYTSFNTSVNLVKGSTYSVELSAGPKADFILVGYASLKNFGQNFKDRNNWVDSRVELSKNNGSSWTAFSAVAGNERDLPLLFTIVGMPKQLK